VTFTECVHSTSRQPREVGVHIRERTSSPRTGTSSLCVVSSNTLTSKQGTVAYLARVPVLTSTQSVDGLFLRTSTIRLTGTCAAYHCCIGFGMYSLPPCWCMQTNQPVCRVLSGVSRDGAQTNHLTTGTHHTSHPTYLSHLLVHHTHPGCLLMSLCCVVVWCDIRVGVVSLEWANPHVGCVWPLLA